MLDKPTKLGRAYEVRPVAKLLKHFHPLLFLFTLVGAIGLEKEAILETEGSPFGIGHIVHEIWHNRTYGCRRLRL